MKIQVIITIQIIIQNRRRKYTNDIIEKAYWINEKKTEMLDYKKKTNLLDNYYKTFAKENRYETN